MTWVPELAVALLLFKVMRARPDLGRQLPKSVAVIVLLQLHRGRWTLQQASGQPGNTTHPLLSSFMTVPVVPTRINAILTRMMGLFWLQ